MFAWYNVGFHRSQLGHHTWHKRLEADLRQLFGDHCAEVVMLSECGEVEVGLGADWDNSMLEFCQKMKPEFNLQFWSDGHYTTLVDTKEIVVLDNPHLVSLKVRDASYRKAQHLVVKPRAGGPVVLYNLHCPASSKHPYHTLARERVVQWVLTEAATGATIQNEELRRQCSRTRFPVYMGGDLNLNEISWDQYARKHGGPKNWKLLHEETFRHGDIVFHSGLVERSGLGGGGSKRGRESSVVQPAQGLHYPLLIPGGWPMWMVGFGWRIVRRLLVATSARQRGRREIVYQRSTEIHQ